ncbi:major facilitator superfamily transporter [Gluconobacter thailandicus F149-1 = NBRC 100600]|uniref:Major facilitator family transporter n=1 Tax=Gluconobacter thailandicus NBRC 3257 TaxID=1381097 RepID=A0ABQ0J169_GLUTH|nr:MFS transporter [Gluconobacter thailandicus]GAC88968.1 major facilitator family transporter [Gluconobacter thailandicus NBRC 3255]GAD28164.1 major facilitator family transporter [Gluconobacter thailandicus NBRC 3257]GAN93780.1 major facilitator superfamily transporter [Gluconobacter thailandicus F149-1 = NBRC 100600]GBR60724.1 major facilitator superfamily transporter [Gluconobacter thailandicus F149-1 = NBRC 100600]GEL88277.1 MFS transporter [Gluconobacter thailandicus F149-1 = NBRC 100600
MIACTIGAMTGVTPVVMITFGLFLAPIADAFHWSHGFVSMAFLMLSLGMAAGSPIAGRISDRFGTRRTILVGFILYTGSLALVGLLQANRAVFLVIFAVIGLTGALPSTMMLARVVATWFDVRRGLMLGIMAGLGNGIGASIMPAIGLAIMAHAGWRATYPVLALIVLVTAFPVGFVWLRDAGNPITLPKARAHEVPADDIAFPPHAPKELTHQDTLGSAAKQPTFWIILLTIASGAGCITALIAHLIPILTSRGIPIAQALLIMSVMTRTCAVWQVIIGHIMDRTRAGRTIMPFYLAALAGILLLQSSSFIAVVVGGFAVGVAMGTEFGALPYVVSRYFGLAAYGRIAGTMYAAVMLAQGITPVLMDISYDHTGNYRLSLGAMTAVFACGSLALCALPTYPTGSTKTF